MANNLPLHKHIKVWVKRRKNNSRMDGTKSVSFTLEWVEFGKRTFQSLGKHATLSLARQAARLKEQQLNSLERHASLDPITWNDFTKKYLEMTYPGHNLPLKERRDAEKTWPKSRNTKRREQQAIDNFGRIIEPGWCHEITAEHRDLFIQTRLPEVGSALSVDAELRTLRLLCNVMKEWKHRGSNENPFAGYGKASVGSRRKRTKRQEGKTLKAKHLTRPQIVAILNRTDAEVLEQPNWEKKRLRALIYFVAYTGARIREVLHLEWKDIDWDKGVAWLFFKVQNALKTDGSEAPFGLPA